MKFSVRTIIQLFTVLYRKKAPIELTSDVYHEVGDMKSAKRALRILSPDIRKHIEDCKRKIRTGK